MYSSACICNASNMPKYAIENMQEICINTQKYANKICKNMPKYAIENMHQICKYIQKYAVQYMQ